MLLGASPLDRALPAGEGSVRIVRGGASIAQPTLGAAILAAQPHDRIELGTGTYVGPFVVSHRPDLTLRAAPQAHAVLTLRDARFAVPNGLWVPLEGVARVWRSGAPVGMSIHRGDGRRILWAKDRAHFDELRRLGIAVALREAGRTLLFLEGDDPRTTPLLVSASDAAVITCDQSPRLRLEALDVRFGGAQGIDLRAGCDGAVVDGVSVYGGRDGIRIKHGFSQRVTLRRSWIVNHLDPRWFWRDVKANLLMEGIAVALGGNAQLLEDSVIEGWFNGVGTPCPGCRNADTIVRRCLLRGILDDAFELDGLLVRGQFYENRVVDAFVGVSFDPRFSEPGQPTRLYRNWFETTRRPPFDRALHTVGRPSFTKLQPSLAADGTVAPPGDVDFYQNTLIGDAEIAKGAPHTGSPGYPVRMRWRNNMMISRAGPIVRHTGSPVDGNVFEGNLYAQLEAGPMFQNWALPAGYNLVHDSLDAARRSLAGRAAGWEARGVQGIALSMDSAPPLPSGWPDSVPLIGGRDRGALEAGPLRVDRVDMAPTGWLHMRGQGFAPGIAIPYQGAPLADLVVLSSTAALGRPKDPSGR
jgi:hypothetical protein